MTKILLLNDGQKFDNWGIKAATDGIVGILKNQFPDAEFMYLPQEILSSRRFNFDPSIKGRMIFNRQSRFAPKLFGLYFELPRVADEFEHVAEKWLNRTTTKGSLKVVNLIAQADVVVFNAEGSTYRINTSALRALFMLWFAKVKMGKKAFFLNGSVTLTRVDAILPAFVSKAFRALDGVSVREPLSATCVAEWFPDLKNKVHMVPDSAFSIDVSALSPSPALKNFDFSKEYFCFSSTMLPVDYAKTKGKAAVCHLLREVQKICPNIVLLAIDHEDLYLADAAKHVGATYIGPTHTYADVMKVLSGAKFLISGRYHHLIFASMVGCPGIALDTTSHKIHGLSRLFPGLMNTPFDPTNLFEETPRIVAHAQDVLKNQKKLSAAFKKQAAQYKNAVQQLGKIVAKSLK